MEAGKGTRWRWLGRAAVGVAVVVILGVGYAFISRKMQGDTDAKVAADAVAETDRLDPDWRWNTLRTRRQQPPPGRNGADVVNRLGTVIPGNWGGKLNDSSWEPAANPPASNVRHRNEVLVEARAQLASLGPALQTARSLKNYPTGYRELAPFSLNSVLLDHTQKTRTVSYVLKWDVAVAADEGDVERAADALLALLNTSRSIGDEPSFISQLVRMATRAIAGYAVERVLGQMPLSDADLARLQAAWATDMDDPLLRYALRGERAYTDEVVIGLADGSIPQSEVSEVKDEGWGDRIRGGFRRPRYFHDRAELLRYFNRVLEATALPFHEQLAAMKLIPPPDSGGDKRSVCLLLGTSTDRVADVGWRSAARARCVPVLLACERFRLKHGRWPANPAEIPPELLPGGVPLDPFDGRPLRYKPLADGVAVYSVGVNRIDDGGAVDQEDREKDIGFRLWNLADRRKPAPPPAPPEAPPVPEP